MTSLHAPSTHRVIGPGAIGFLVVTLAALWLVMRPSGEPLGSFVGQLIGAEAILLMSIALVLISTLPWIDTYFDGIDRAAIWHRRVAIAGMLLVVPHILRAHGGLGPSWAGPAGIVSTVGLAVLVVWAILPRWRSVVPEPGRKLIAAIHESPPMRLVSRLVGDYEIWRQVHRTTGVFVAIGFAHGVADGTPWEEAPVLRWTYVVIGGIGL